MIKNGVSKYISTCKNNMLYLGIRNGNHVGDENFNISCWWTCNLDGVNYTNRIRFMVCLHSHHTKICIKPTPLYPSIILLIDNDSSPFN